MRVDEPRKTTATVQESLGSPAITSAEPPMPISRAGPEPAYSKIQRLIARQIADGTLRLGDQLPPERVLCEQFGVSRVTLRRALKALAAEGLLTPTQGRGWYATPERLSEPPNSLVSFSTLAEARGLTVENRVLRCTIREVTDDEAEQLGVSRDERVVDIERLRLLDHEPVAVMLSTIAVSRAPGLDQVDFSSTSLYDVLADRFDIRPTYADYAVEAQAADERTAPLLNLEVGAPILAAAQTTYDQDGKAVELGRLLYRGDRYRFRSTLTRPLEAPLRAETRETGEART